jgi:signal recognition particle subunit SRP54
MAQRILGMGDVMTLVEKAESQFDAEQARELERKIRTQQFTLDDFLDQLRQVRRMGPLTGLLKMIPGLGGAELSGMKIDDRELDRVQAIITSMTPQERSDPSILNGSRRRRIAAGSGTSIHSVNQLVKQFGQMQKVMRQIQKGRMPSIEQLMAGR